MFYLTIYNDITETIGKTPLVRLNQITGDLKPNILAKIEAFNPGGSVKDRIGMSMIDAAERAHLLKPGVTIVEPTSGNTGIGLAIVAAVKGYQLTLTMPESMSIERRKILHFLGAELVLTEASKGMPGAVEKANEIAKQEGKVFIPQQFKNLANPEIHRQTTAREIINDTDGDIAAFVGGVGTGGTVTGVGEILKNEIGSHIKIFAVEPVDSPVLSGGLPGPHKIQGIGAGFIPDVMNMDTVDSVIQVTLEDAIKTSQRLARLEGIFVGISSGAAAWAALSVAKEFKEAENIVVVLPDTAERYLTTDLFAFEE
jgi:cysteine synthase A